MRLLAVLALLLVPATASAAPAFTPSAPTTLASGQIEGYDLFAAPGESGFLAAWSAGGNLSVQRYDAAGAPDGEPEEIAARAINPAVGYDVAAGDFVVASAQGADGDVGTRVVVQRVGLMASSTVSLFKDPSENRHIRIACHSESCLAAWYDAGRKRILARHITAAGLTGDTALRLSRRLRIRNSYPDLAGDVDILPVDGGFFVSWTHSTGRGLDIHGRAVGPDGQPTSGEVLLADTDRRYVPIAPRLCSGGDGPPVLAWFGALGKKRFDGLYAQAFDAVSGAIIGEDHRYAPRIRYAAGSVSDVAESPAGDCVLIYGTGRRTYADVLGAMGDIERRDPIPARFNAMRLDYSPTAGVGLYARRKGTRNLSAVTLPGT